jgi:cell wall-associated NlpC family hydrolase
MSINPLQRNAAQQLVADKPGLGANKPGGSSIFEALLGSAGSKADSLPRQGQQAAELLRMEMMQSSLSLSGEDQASRPGSVKALESLLAAFAANKAMPAAGKAAVEPQAAQLGEVAGPEAPATAARIEEIGKTAAQFIGTPYRFGGEGPAGIDCSSFVQQVFREHQIDLPRTAREQSQVGSEVAQGDLRKGDLVFFQTYASYPSHVGIYLGDGKMIHASSGKGEVAISDINSGYYRSRYLGAKRIA